jgi:Mrp family chromosome partitioning ATPase/capsular polysaccharide biosynthesis protein
MMSSTPDEPPRDEVGYAGLAVARRRWWVIALTTIFAVGVAVAGLSLVTPAYQATATLQAPITGGVQAPTDLTYTDRLMNTYVQLTQQPILRAEVARRLGQRQLPRLSLAIETNTELLEISARDRSPIVAQRAANVAASVLVAKATALANATSQAGENALGAQLAALTDSITRLRIQLAGIPSGSAVTSKRLTLQESISGKQADYQALVQQRAQLQLADAVHDQTLSIVQAASLPTSPASPRWPPVLALALALGLLGGVALVFSLERFGPRLYTMEAIESAGDALVMVAIPRVTGKLTDSSLYNGGSPAHEAFGVIAVQVLAAAQARRVRTILVTSPRQADGKSTVAANLAAELARSGHRVVLVDADMRSPTLHTIFGVDRALGLSDLLESSELPSNLDDFSRVLLHEPSPAPSAHALPGQHLMVQSASRSLEDVIRTGMVTGVLKGGSWIEHPSLPKGKVHGKQALKKFLQENPDGLAVIRQEIMDIMHAEQIEARQKADARLLPAGSENSAPAQLLASERLARLVDGLIQNCDFVVFDAPPLVVSDPLSIARMADLVLLVVGGQAVPDRDVQAARRQLRSVGAEEVAIVVNRWRGHDPSYSYSYRGSS